MSRYICIHGHFYQPPRENPWLEEVEIQDTSYPYHDWNQKITAECYAPNAVARILNKEGKIVDIVNNYTRISFDFGPTLLSWMQKNDPETYQTILTADQESQKIFSGHGCALAQCYNHLIMPLANKRDKKTQVIWGIKDFKCRYQRDPEGMWLPETAVDLETLDLMADHGIKFTILAPHQAKAVREGSSGPWKDVCGAKIDIRKPYLCRLPSGQTISIFFYDGPTSQDIAFGGLLRNGEDLMNRLEGLFSPDDNSQNEIVHVATDGETYGHHHHMGDMALAYCLDLINAEPSIQITNYGEYLEKNPPVVEVKIYENSSWSCVHGVARWKSDCGCHSGGHPEWNQQWRKPLREGMNWLRDELIRLFESTAALYLTDPWAARDEYINVILNRDDNSLNDFLARHSAKRLNPEERTKVFQLLEMQRHALLMYTSCGWFFDDISGIETVQILQYAARAIQLARKTCDKNLQDYYFHFLKNAKSNSLKFQNGLRIYENQVTPTVLDLVRVGAHFAVSSLFEEYPEVTQIYSYTAQTLSHECTTNEKQKLVIGKAKIRSNITEDENVVTYTVFHQGDHQLVGGVRESIDEKAFVRMQQDLKESLKNSDITATVGIIDKHFENGHYALRHLFKDEQAKILYQILDETLIQVERSLRQINEYHYPIIHVVKQLHIPLPKVLANTVLVMLNTDLLQVLGSEDIDFKKLKRLVSEVVEWSLEVDRITLSFITQRKIEYMLNRCLDRANDNRTIAAVGTLLKVLEPLGLKMDIWKIQNMYFAIGKKYFSGKKTHAEKGDIVSQKWLKDFRSLGQHLKIWFED